MRRRTRRALVGAAAVPVAAIVVLGVEVQLARSGPDLLDDTPLVLDGRVGSGANPLRMVWLGDSTAAGLGASTPDGAMPRRVAAGLGGAVDLTVLAVSGDRVSDVVDDQVDRVAALAPHVVLVSVGANDVVHLTSRSSFRRSYERLVDSLPPDAELVLLGVPDMGAPPRLAQPLRAIAGLRGRQLDGEVRAVARDAGATYIDIAGETGPQMRAESGRRFARDRYHPNDEGYALWADAVLDGLPHLDARDLEVADAHR